MKMLMVIPRIFKNVFEPEHFPVGMAYVSAAQKKAGYDVDVLNLNFSNKSTYENLKKTLLERHYDIVETGGITINYKLIKEIVDIVKQIDHNLYTLVGGGIITSAPEVVMHGLQNVDFGIIGEGEITNIELVKALIYQLPLDEVDGLIYWKRDGNRSELIRNKNRMEIQDLDSLPWPDYEGFQLDKMLKYAPKNYLTMSTGRSCLYQCTFCFHTSGRTYRQRSLDSFFRELDFVAGKYNIDNIYITDELFAFDTKRLNEFCDRIKNYHILWAVQLRVDIITESLLQQLKDAGCIILSLGLESADNKILKSMKKNITIEQIEYALQCCKKVDIQANGSFIFGDVEEDRESALHTINWWQKHRQYNINLELIQIFPGTALYQYAVQNKIITNELEFIENGCPFVNVSKLSDHEYKNLAVNLDEIQAEATTVLQDIKIIGKDKHQRKVDIIGKCGHCGSALELKGVHAVKISNNLCSHCKNQCLLTPVVMFRENISKNLKRVLSNNKVVFYQATKYYSDLLIYFGDIIEKCLVVDDREIKQGQKMRNVVVQAPDQICDETACIVCDYIYDGTYKYKVLHDNPNIREAIGIWELIQPF